jgi:hypothetical protein
VFWPAAFFVGGDKQNAAELARLRGEMDEIEKLQPFEGAHSPTFYRLTSGIGSLSTFGTICFIQLAYEDTRV